jgi:hypothetical protein
MGGGAAVAVNAFTTSRNMIFSGWTPKKFKANEPGMGVGPPSWAAAALAPPRRGVVLSFCTVIL